jgi:ubiquinone/menaquinone biosynthesis C-methylase UbiE
MGQAIADPDHIREVNARYHDAAARSYDSKWAIDYGATGARQVMMKVRKALGHEPERYEDALEVGAGTGYFSLNLLRAGVIDNATAVDISSGMLAVLSDTAERLGLSVETVCADAERLPLPDESFDLVFGHAVLHHLPSLETALAEFSRVLKPGGTLAIMGEPSRNGDRLAWMPKRLGGWAAPMWRRLLRTGAGAPPQEEPREEPASAAESNGAELESVVDVHTFDPDSLQALAANAGFEDVRVTGEELLANTYGWWLRALEAGSDPARVPLTWHRFAFRSYLTLQWIDGRLLEPRLPAGLFYNLLLSGRKPD